MYLPPFVFSVIFQHVFSAVCQLALLLGSVRNILPVSVKMKMTGPHNPTQQTAMCGNCKNTGHTIMNMASFGNETIPTTWPPKIRKSIYSQYVSLFIHIQY